MLSFLIENGIALHLRDFTSAKLTQKTNSLLLEKLKYELPLNTVIEAVKHYYGNFMEARDAFGLNKKKPVFDLSREQLLDIVKVVAREHPEASASSLRAGHLYKRLNQVTLNRYGTGLISAGVDDDSTAVTQIFLARI